MRAARGRLRREGPPEYDERMQRNTEDARMFEPKLIIEDVDDPAITACARGQHGRCKCNSDWLQAHWADLLSQVRWKFVAVAVQEAFISATPVEAWRLARAAHPDDDGAISQYVFPEGGPRIYAHCR